MLLVIALFVLSLLFTGAGDAHEPPRAPAAHHLRAALAVAGALSDGPS